MKKAPKNLPARLFHPRPGKSPQPRSLLQKRKRSRNQEAGSPKAAKKSVPKQTVSDYIADMAGAKFGDLCDYWVGMNDGRATLADLLEDMENAHGIVQD